MKQLILMGAIALFSITTANAQGQTKQKANCCNTKHAKHNANVTHRERANIKKQKQDVQLAKRVAMADGRVTPAEQRIIQQQKKQAHNTAYRANNNNRYRH